ncbi:MAG TPA: CopD family protein [Acidisoma sp.]|jgi:putative copper export protein|uniref:copper resistance D family protein n=1 Tax=Acidisoma sp. TaxID=1872115 RepID=UPI002C9F32E3|nr:CopD family protein [Acidisoma sp.]HTI01015.1 CopD family protein [Acidisoma sp.]
MPPFDLSDSGGIGLVLLRGLSDLCCLGLFGTAVLRLWVAPAGLAFMPQAMAAEARRRLRRVTWAAGGAALLSLALWLVFTARSLADATSLHDTIAATGIVLHDTSFGHVVTAQCLALLVAIVCASSWGIAAQAGLVGASALVVMLQACHGHAFAMGNDGLLAIACLHLLAGGAWLGGLPAFLGLISRAPPDAAAALCHRFSPMGQVAVLLLAVSALIQGLVMIETPANLIGTAYGWTALIKATLFTLLLTAASFNRFVATPRLQSAEQAGHGRRLLLRGIAAELVLGFLVILAAGLLASLPPVMRM